CLGLPYSLIASALGLRNAPEYRPHLRRAPGGLAASARRGVPPLEVALVMVLTAPKRHPKKKSSSARPHLEQLEDRRSGTLNGYLGSGAVSGGRVVFNAPIGPATFSADELFLAGPNGSPSAVLGLTHAGNPNAAFVSVPPPGATNGTPRPPRARNPGATAPSPSSPRESPGGRNSPPVDCPGPWPPSA